MPVAARALSMERRLALRIFMLSISSWLAMPMPTLYACSMIHENRLTLSFSFKSFESVTPFLSFGKFFQITQEETTGPARGPRPASSIPPTRPVSRQHSLVSFFFELRGFSSQVSQIEELRTSHLALARRLYLVDKGECLGNVFSTPTL